VSLNSVSQSLPDVLRIYPAENDPAALRDQRDDYHEDDDLTDVSWSRAIGLTRNSSAIALSATSVTPEAKAPAIATCAAMTPRAILLNLGRQRTPAISADVTNPRRRLYASEPPAAVPERR